MHKERLTRLRRLMAGEGAEALLVTCAVNRNYMSGFTGSSGFLLITADRALLYSDFRYRLQAPEQAKAYEFREHGASAIESVKQAVKELGIRQLAFEPVEMSFAEYEKYKAVLGEGVLVPSEGWIEKLRMTKDAGELQIMREAAQLADKTFEHMVGMLKPGMRELDAALEIEFFMRRHGATSSSFETIVASGERSALPHGVASERVIGSGEFVKLDFGAYYKGYCSDLTRTVMIGEPTARHREIYGIVREAQQAALNGIRPGLTGIEADALARDIIKSHGYGDYFGHGTGHGLGMEIHEAPRLSVSGNLALEPGMTVTVEPGIYIPGFGGVRIEDDVVVTDTGVEILTHATKDFIIIT